MRVLKICLLAVLALIMILIAIANREPVVVELLPSQLGFVTSWQREIPLFLVMFGMAIGGFVLGWSWEWLRETKTAMIARRRRKEIERLEGELAQLRQDSGTQEDDVLALLK
ncbi:LapA family protein [Pontivivens insulae]|uniref:Lipopolysaccharide assembly protein A n=1 Tax=Pontivivens insulae TaxID=1639689 RepID=A0A2R8ADC1_9RHOB|nr:LapA family protein [Pontivivens insulae]RED14125.1 uncharacterized protein DUF1049 [Pontivivens insulae]SPF30199.1 Lipopolysaccharide assembly protein A [Pontivivens insulae]